MNDDNTVEFGNKKENKPDVKKESSSTKLEAVKSFEHKISNVGVNDVQNFDSGMRSTVKSNNTASNSFPVGSGIEQGSTSIESEIDSENRARLEQMSADEIAEAQDEIMKKMNPDLIKILQKRGQKKMKKTSSINSSVIGSIGEVFDDIIKKESTSDNAHNIIITNTNNIQNGLENEDVQEIKSTTNSLWDTWSTNVEAARDLRFTLDGDVINDYGQEPGNDTYDI